MQAHGLQYITVRQVVIELPLLWHLSDISAICNFWRQVQILWGSAPRDGLPEHINPTRWPQQRKLCR